MKLTARTERSRRAASNQIRNFLTQLERKKSIKNPMFISSACLEDTRLNMKIFFHSSDVKNLVTMNISETYFLAIRNVSCYLGLMHRDFAVVI